MYPGGALENGDLGVYAKRCERAGQVGLQIRPDLEDRICAFDLAGVGRFEGIGMLRQRAADEQLRLSHALHHGRRQRVHRLDRGQHVGCGNGRHRPEKQGECREGYSQLGHFDRSLFSVYQQRNSLHPPSSGG